MQERHKNREQYFKEQSYTTQKHVIPLIKEVIPLDPGTRILEIGCGEGGNLAPFLDLGCKIVGVDMTPSKIDNAHKFYDDHLQKENIEFILADIYDVNGLGQFDLVYTRDVLEHIHDQERFMAYVMKFLKPDGKFFLGFPPWQNPFGGHQQMCNSKFLSRLPYFHLLPRPVYRFVLKAFRENPNEIKNLLEIKDTRINIERFERILRRNGYKTDRRNFYFINPNYEVKFNMKPRKLSKLISSVPWIRNFFITTNYYIVSIKENPSV